MVIRVVPGSLQAYGTRAGSQFNDIGQSLQALVTTVVEVDYFGPNADTLKTHCGALAVEFSAELIHRLAAIVDVISQTTSGISRALGEMQPVVIPFEAVPPAVNVGGAFRDDGTREVRANVGALGELPGQVTAAFGAIEAILDEHLSALSATNWDGNAKTQAVAAVSSYTAGAKALCAQYNGEIVGYLNDQIQSLASADA
ncbi:MAG: hypothetical protein AAF467_12260 [Actinomycetota bacterium]